MLFWLRKINRLLGALITGRLIFGRIKILCNVCGCSLHSRIENSCWNCYHYFTRYNAGQICSECGAKFLYPLSWCMRCHSPVHSACMSPNIWSGIAAYCNDCLDTLE